MLSTLEDTQRDITDSSRLETLIEERDGRWVVIVIRVRDERPVATWTHTFQTYAQARTYEQSLLEL